MTLHYALGIAALVCLILAAFGAPSSRISLGWLGMALWVASGAL